jgi:hypothetical protein
MRTISLSSDPFTATLRSINSFLDKIAMSPDFVNEKDVKCQEQIDLSGLLANELSAFLFFNESHWEQEMSGGRSLVSPLRRSYP